MAALGTSGAPGMSGWSRWPLGLTGLYGSGGGLAPNPATFKDQEDYVLKLLDETDPGVLALIYKALYAIGYRIDACDQKINDLKKRLAPTP